MSDNVNNGGNQIAETLKELLQIHKDTLKVLEQIRDRPRDAKSKNPR